MRKKTINSITFLNILSTILLQGISFISAPVISRLLGPENYGVASVYITWSLVITIIFGGQTLSTIPMGKARYPESAHKQFQSSILGLSITLFAGGSLLVYLFAGKIASLLQMQQLFLAFAVIQAYGQNCVDFLHAKFTYDYEADKNVVLSVSVSLAVFIVSVLLIRRFPRETNYWGRIAGMSAVYTVYGLAISVWVIKRGKVFYNKEYWRFALSLSMPLVVHAISGQVLSQSDRVMLQQMNGTAVAGIYSLTAAFGGILLTIWCALNNSWTPFLYGYLKAGQTDEIEKRGRNYLELFSVLTIGFVLLAPEVFRVFASPEYWNGVLMIPMFAIGAFFRFLYAFPSGYEFFALKTKMVAAGTLVTGIMNIILNFCFIPLWGANGAALATMISNIMLFVFHHICVLSICKEYAYPFRIPMLLPYIVVVCTVSAAVMMGIGTWYVRWIAGALLGCWELWRMIKRKSIF